MAINFPDTPSVNDTHVVGGVTYTWDGVAWRTSGLGVQGVTGTQGSEGTQGTQGTTGAGTQGADGTQGAEGTQGTQGTTGSGAQGADGTQGTEGTQGTQGTTGAGTQGADGTQGTEGTQGADGTQGTAGTGAQGADGTQGTQGTSGTQGTQGTNGTQGTQGTQGTNGTQGTQGTQGLQGVQGVTGTAGQRTIGITVDGAGAVVTTGLKGFTEVPYAGTIVGWKIVANASGSCVFDVWKSNAAIPSVANTITASAKPTLTTAQRAASSTLTGWTTSVSANDTFGFNVDSASTITRVTLLLTITVS